MRQVATVVAMEEATAAATEEGEGGGDGSGEAAAMTVAKRRCGWQ